MNKLVCKLCNKHLGDNITLSHAIDMANRHQNFRNDYLTDNRCENRSKKLDLTDTFYMQEYTKQELRKIDYDRYMQSANL